MKRIFTAMMLSVICVICLAACGNGGSSGNEEGSCDVAMIVDSDVLDEGSFAYDTWMSIEKACSENDLTARYFTTEEQSQEKYIEAVGEATEAGAGLVVLPGSNFETTAYAAQSAFPDADFLLIDGVPHDEASNYATAANTVSVVFAEEESGYLAGYAAVKDGYTELGFMGGEALPSVKRYGYGFVQGAAAAAAEDETKVNVKYHYTGTFDRSKEVRKLAESWYEDKTQVIFACGGSMNASVMKAAENKNGMVIGSDIDQSGFSDTVITSAEKNLDTAVSDIVKSYAKDSFPGARAFNYAAKNDGVMLEMDNSKFERFTKEDYESVLKKLRNGKIELKKDTGVKSVAELAGDYLTVQEQ